MTQVLMLRTHSHHCTQCIGRNLLHDVPTTMTSIIYTSCNTVKVILSHKVFVYTVIHTTLSQKKWGTHIMPHNSCKCGPILIILLLLNSQMNSRKWLNKIGHLTSNLLLHYRAKVECSTLLLYRTLFNANVMQNHLFTISVYQRC